MAINFSFSQTGTSHFAQVIGSSEAKFLVGKETVYEGDKHGLYNYSTPNGAVYDPVVAAQEYGYWAYFIAPTAKGESKNSFICLNTYDRAQFTFGFLQYAAHVPNGDFVKFFKEMLALPSAAFYFPKLKLQNDRIHYIESSGSLTQLEDNASTAKLMRYLNPTLDGIETQELICCARMVHWTTLDPALRDLQVDFGIRHFKKNMAAYAAAYNLDGYPDKICQLICDIRHQGRAKSQHIIQALNTSSFDTAYTRLLQFGEPNHHSRIVTVKNTIKQLTDQGIFGKMYDAGSNEFV